jgi:hypothetical protein
MKAVLTAVFTALCLGTNYAMTSLPNVKIMDALVFIAGFMFGLDVGCGVAIMTRLVYGFFNPYGPAPFPLILFLIAGECFYAVAGVALRKWSLTGDLLKAKNSFRGMSYLFGLVGFVATFAYDALTNFATYLFLVDSLYQAFIIGMITGVPFGVLHELTNVVFFATVVPATIAATRRLGPRISLVMSR